MEIIATVNAAALMLMQHGLHPLQVLGSCWVGLIILEFSIHNIEIFQDFLCNSFKATARRGGGANWNGSKNSKILSFVLDEFQTKNSYLLFSRTPNLFIFSRLL